MTIFLATMVCVLTVTSIALAFAAGAYGGYWYCIETQDIMRDYIKKSLEQEE